MVGLSSHLLSGQTVQLYQKEYIRLRGAVDLIKTSKSNRNRTY